MNDDACRAADGWPARRWYDALEAFLAEHRLCRPGLDDPHITETVTALWCGCGARIAVGVATPMMARRPPRRDDGPLPTPLLIDLERMRWQAGYRDWDANGREYRVATARHSTTRAPRGNRARPSSPRNGRGGGCSPMARRKRPSAKKAAPSPTLPPADAAAQLPMFEAPSGAAELRVFPHALLPGDVVRDALGEGVVAHVPSVYREGKRVHVKLRLANGEERVLDLAAHEKVPVRRPSTEG